MDIDPGDLESINDMRLAAAGDAAAQYRLSCRARQLVLAGECDEIIGSVEGVSYARLAAAQGLPDALLLIAEHCGHLANVYYECGATEAGDSWHAQVIAILELSAELLPGPSSYELTQALNVAADEASPDIMEEAKMLRDLFAPLFAPNAQTATYA
jgi:hypothetical protein